MENDMSGYITAKDAVAVSRNFQADMTKIYYAINEAAESGRFKTSIPHSQLHSNLSTIGNKLTKLGYEHNRSNSIPYELEINWNRAGEQS